MFKRVQKKKLIKTLANAKYSIFKWYPTKDRSTKLVIDIIIDMWNNNFCFCIITNLKALKEFNAWNGRLNDRIISRETPKLSCEKSELKKPKIIFEL